MILRSISPQRRRERKDLFSFCFLLRGQKAKNGNSAGNSYVIGILLIYGYPKITLPRSG
jgi:hypothetical protein